MASQAAAILRVVERKRQEKQRAILAKNRQFNLSQQFYADPIAQQVGLKFSRIILLEYCGNLGVNVFVNVCK